MLKVQHHQYAGRLVQFESDQDPLGQTLRLEALGVEGAVECDATIRTITMNPFLPNSPIVIELESPELQAAPEDWIVKIKDDRSPKHEHAWEKNYKLTRRGRWIIIHVHHILFQPTEPVVFGSAEAAAAKIGEGLPIKMSYSTTIGPHDETRVLPVGLGQGMICIKAHAGLNWVERINALRLDYELSSRQIRHLRYAMLDSIGVIREQI